MLISLFCRKIVYSHEKESVGGLSQRIKAKTGVIRQKEESETVDSLGTVNLVCTFFFVCKLIIWKLAGRSPSGQTVFK